MYVNVAFSLQISSHKIENNYKKDSPRTDKAVLFEHMLPKEANHHSEQRNLYSEFSCVLFMESICSCKDKKYFIYYLFLIL